MPVSIMAIPAFTLTCGCEPSKTSKGPPTLEYPVDTAEEKACTLMSGSTKSTEGFDKIAFRTSLLAIVIANPLIALL